MFKFARGIAKTILLHKPFNVRLWLTGRCNYRCAMCNVSSFPFSSEMTLPELEQVACNLKRMGASQIVFTGGEPLLRADIVDIIKLFHPFDFDLRLQTNGGPHVTEKILTECYDAGLQDISVSIDTLNAEKQDIICNSSAVLANALRVLRFCVKEHGDRGFVSANVVVSRKNFFELPDLARYLHDLGVFFNPCVYVRPFSCIPELDGSHNQDKFSLLGLPPAEVKRIFFEISALMRRGYKILATKRVMKDLREYMLTGRYSWRCAAGILSFDVAPGGELLPCCDTISVGLKDPTANVKDKDFAKQYKKRDFQAKMWQQRQMCPGCLYACYREPKYLTYDVGVQLDMLYKGIVFRKLLH